MELNYVSTESLKLRNYRSLSRDPIICIPCPWPDRREQLLSLRSTGSPRLASSVRDKVNALGCARRGCRAGRTLYQLISDVNNDGHKQNIAVITGNRRSTRSRSTVRSVGNGAFVIGGNRRSFSSHQSASTRSTVEGTELVPPSPRHAVRRRSAARRIHLLRPTITSVPPVTLIGSFNAHSVGKRYAAIYDRIVSGRLHLCAIVETWHDSSDDPHLIACAPPGYRYIDKARRRRDDDSEATMTTNHGGICLFYASNVGAREIPLPFYDTMEVLAVYVNGGQHNVLVVVVYRPGSAVVTGAFFNEFADILERTSSFASPIVILGDIN